MIETITVPLDEFDLAGFYEAYKDFYRKVAGDDADPDISITVMERFDSTPTPIYEDRDPLDELTGKHWLLFFQLHEPLVDDRVLCIDGVRRVSDEFDIGVADGYGFLVEVHDGKISLHPALYDGSSGPFPRIDLQGHCSVLDNCLINFARRFMSQS